MTVLIIIGSILLILIILLTLPVRGRAAYYDKKLSYDVKDSAFTLIDSEKEKEVPDEGTKPKRPKKPRKNDEEDTSSAEETEAENDPAEEKPPDEVKAEDAPETPET
ncbi:MAG: hypothetical protein ILP19_08360, partial [Oscillospiraceae bacterium]|nr:hypothetical protein [Oscillospiraceae bacterium]